MQGLCSGGNREARQAEPDKAIILNISDRVPCSVQSEGKEQPHRKWPALELPLLALHKHGHDPAPGGIGLGRAALHGMVQHRLPGGSALLPPDLHNPIWPCHHTLCLAGLRTLELVLLQEMLQAETHQSARSTGRGVSYLYEPGQIKRPT